MKKTIVLAGLCALAMSSVKATASTNYCEEPKCDAIGSSSHSNFAKSTVNYKHSRKANSAILAKAQGGETLHGELSGAWDAVSAVVTFPWQSEEGLDLNLVALSLPAQALGNAQYSATGWQRELFFLDLGDGVPRLLSSYLIDADFSPQSGDVIDQSGQLWISQYALYQEAEELAADADYYAGYAEEAAVADVRFVANDAGEVLQVAIDIYDDAGNYQYSVEPQINDRLNPSFLGYDVQQPDILYALFYFEQPTPLSQPISLQRTYYVPNANSDSTLPVGFDASELELAVLFEGVKSLQGESSFAYSTPQGLGYTWGQAQQSNQSSNNGIGSSSGSGSGSGSGMVTPWLLILLSALALLRPGLRRARR